MDGYGAGQAPDGDLAECRQAVLDQATNGPPGMMVWLDAKKPGLAVQISDLPHVVAVCGTPVVIPAAVLRSEGAQPALLKALEGQRQP